MARRVALLLEEETVSHERVLSLLADGADPCRRPRDGRSSALLLSVERDDPSLLQLLLSHTTDENTREKSAALAMAVNTGSLECVRVLLQPALGSPELINLRTGAMGFTPLLIAVSEGHRDIVKFLLESGADPHLTDAKGRSPVHLAAIRGSMELLQDLKHFGADMCPLDRNGNLPIHFCSHPDVIEYLHHEGNKTDIRNDQGSTPLETIVRINPASPAVALLQRLEKHDSEPEHRRTQFWRQMMATGIGWKLIVFVLLVICIFSWQLTVYLHGQSPLHFY